MPTTPPARDAYGRIDKRAAILDAAFHDFARLGYDQASLDAIAARAGVAKATIYNHFGDKVTLLRQTIAVEAEHAVARNLEVVEQLTDRPDDLRKSLEDVGYQLLVCYFEERSLAFHRLMAAEITQFPDLLDIMRERSADRVMRALADRLARLTITGCLRITDPDMAADQYWALLIGPAQTRSRLGTRAVPNTELHEVAHAAIDTFLRAFAVPDENPGQET